MIEKRPSVAPALLNSLPKIIQDGLKKRAIFKFFNSWICIFTKQNQVLHLSAI